MHLKVQFLKGTEGIQRSSKELLLRPFLLRLSPPFYLKPNQNQIKTVEGVIGGVAPLKIELFLCIFI
jgi:hypothetical protein